LGLSSKPDGRYDKKNQTQDLVGVLDALGVRTAEFVTHDIGIMVGFAIAATHPERMSRWGAIDAPLPGAIFYCRKYLAECRARLVACLHSKLDHR